MARDTKKRIEKMNELVLRATVTFGVEIVDILENLDE